MITSDMENPAKSMQEPTSLEIEIGLKKAGFRSLRAWCRKRGVNRFTAWAAWKGVRHGPKSVKILQRMRRDANV